MLLGQQPNLVILPLIAILSACSSDPDQPLADSDLPTALFDDSRSWLLTSYTSVGSNTRVTAFPGLQITFAFATITNSLQDPVTGFVGYDGCNDYGAEIEIVDGNTIVSTGAFRFTDQECTFLDNNFQPLVQVDVFNSVIENNVIFFEFIPEQLNLTTPAGNSLRFQPCRPNGTLPASDTIHCDPL